VYKRFIVEKEFEVGKNWLRKKLYRCMLNIEIEQKEKNAI
jgi:hypothetical protein